jgi:hypothetical protein
MFSMPQLHEGDGIALVPVAISIAFFLGSPQSQPLGRRILASVHGLSISLIYAITMIIVRTGHA